MDERSEEDAIYIIIGDAIRRRRKEINVRQQDLAEQIGLTRTSIVNIEAGRQHLPIHVLCAIAAILKVPVAALFQDVPSTFEVQKRISGIIQLQLEIVRLRKQLTKIREIVVEEPQQEEHYKGWMDA